MESKVKSLNPEYDDSGNHKTWRNPQGVVFYSFSIELEDGKRGNVLGKKESGPAYSVGDTVVYDYIDGKIKQVKKVDKIQSQFKSYYDDPEVQKSITCNHCMKLAIVMLSTSTGSKKGDFYKITSKFFDWCYSNFTDNQMLLNKRAALERAVEAFQLQEEKTDGIKVLDLADSILEWTLLKLQKQ